MTASITQSNVNHAQLVSADLQATGAMGPTGDPTVGLSPDALLAYIAAKLSDSDSEIKTMLNHQKLVENEQGMVQKLMNEVSSLESQINKDSNGNGTLSSKPACKQLEQDIEDTVNQIQAMDPGCAALGDLRALHDRVMATGTGPYDGHGYYNGSMAGPGDPPNGPSAPSGDRPDTDSTFGADELKDFSDTLQGINSDLSSGAQIEMIQLQSKVSDRSTAIQLATNIMQSVYDSEQKTVGNIHA
jgi:hypothetical protein